MNYYKEPFTKISQEKRDTILQAATFEFAERGFDSANINVIAQKAGISVGSIYKYFGSKEDFFLTTIDTGVETLKSILDGIMGEEKDLMGRIRRIIRAVQTYSRSDAQLTKLYNEMATESHSELVWKIVSDMEGATAGRYADMIGEAKEAGILREGIDTRLFAFFLDNLFILLQFSYACEYYKERLKLYVDENVLGQDDLVEEQLLLFIRGAFLKDGV
ncbi:MAG: TetR/AcrR family transcriptional regulator [Eubacteriales bacterium]